MINVSNFGQPNGYNGSLRFCQNLWILTSKLKHYLKRLLLKMKILRLLVSNLIVGGLITMISQAPEAVEKAGLLAELVRWAILNTSSSPH